MSVKDRVQDAEFLYANGRYEGALAMLMVAVAASSRKQFPKQNKTKPLERPLETRKDGGAFVSFIEKNSLLPGMRISAVFLGEKWPLEDVLYQFFRNSLIHEGKLAAEVRFVPDLRPGSAHFSTEDGYLSISHGYFRHMLNALKAAPANREEFGLPPLPPVPHISMAAGDEREFRALMQSNFGVSPGVFNICWEIVRLVGSEMAAGMNAGQLTAQLREIVNSRYLNGGSVTGLKSDDLCDWNGVITDKGRRLLNHIGERTVTVLKPS